MPFARIFESNRTAAVVGLIYFLFGTLWILLSDALIETVSTEPGWLQGAQTYKGLVYIVLTTVGLVALIRLGYRRQLAALARAQLSELRVQDLFMNHPKPMWAFDRDSQRFLRVNDAAIAKYGFTRGEFLAMRVQDLRPPGEADGGAPTQASGPQGHDAPTVVRHRRRSGDPIHARVTQHALDVDGRHATLEMAENVTEEVRMGQALESQQAQFRQLHHSLGEVLWTATPDGRQMLYVSPAFADIYGRPVADLLDRPALWMDAVHPDDHDRLRPIESGPDGLRGVTCSYRIVRPDGSVRWVEDRKKLICDSQGTVVMMGGIAEDITARMERDVAQEQLKGRLERLVAERTQALAQANNELEAFSRTAAHDLQTPLNGIVGLSRMLRTAHGGALDARGQRCVALIERSASEMSVLIHDLLALSRAGSAELQRAWVDLLPDARALVDSLRAQAPERVVAVDLPDRLLAWCDAGLMRSVLQNLLGNAWKFSALHGSARISVAVHDTDGLTCITVGDNGAGFDTSQVQGLFRPFQRFHSEAQFHGTGIGLVTCQRIAQRHGGTLSLQSSPGAGTTACVCLPRPPVS